MRRKPSGDGPRPRVLLDQGHWTITEDDQALAAALDCGATLHPTARIFAWGTVPFEG